MKRNFMIIGAIVAGMAMTSCSVDTEGLEELQETMEEASEKAEEATEEATKEAEEEVESTVMYQCPDNCENGPAYFDAGDCKKCGKEMVEI